MSTTIIRGWRLRQLLRYRSEAAGIDDPRKFRIERYQRDYAWGPEDEAEDLFNDLTEHFDGDSGTYVLGNMILCPTSEVSLEDESSLAALRHVEVVDGQQRLTTLLLLFAALREEASERNLGSMRREITDALDGVRLHHHEADMTEFMAGVLAEELPFSTSFGSASGSVRSRSLSNAQDVARHLRSLVKKKAEVDVSSIVMLANRLLEQALVAATIADDRGAALLSFERANARGRDLDATDLLKNYVFMLEEAVVPDRSTWDDIDEKWKSLRSLAEDKTPKLKLADVMRWHHEVRTKDKSRSFTGASLYRNIAAELDSFAGSGIDYLTDLGKTITWIASVHRESRRRVGDEVENVLDGLMGLSLIRGRSQMKQHLPVLLAARAWSVADFRNLARSVESLMLVATVCEIRGQVVDATLRSTVLAIKEHGTGTEGAPTPAAVIEETTRAARTWASERGFDEAVLALRYSSARESLLIRYILSRTDGAVKACANRVAWHDVDMFVESVRLTGGTGSRAVRDDLDHVWPQSRAAEWPGDASVLDTIGNLVLWTHSSNRAAGNAPAGEKLADHYGRDSENRVRWLLARGEDAGSGYDAARDLGLGSPDGWGGEEIEMLGRFYISALYEVFGWDRDPPQNNADAGSGSQA
jgi:hypothetical protein